MNDFVQAVALAIYGTWSRERDPARIEARFKRLPQSTRENFEAEARAAIRACEAHFTGAYTA